MSKKDIPKDNSFISENYLNENVNNTNKVGGTKYNNTIYCNDEVINIIKLHNYLKKGMINEYWLSSDINSSGDTFAKTYLKIWKIGNKRESPPKDIKSNNLYTRQYCNINKMSRKRGATKHSIYDPDKTQTKFYWTDIVPPRNAVALLSFILPAKDQEEVFGDLEEIFYRMLKTKGINAARWCYWSHVIRSTLGFIFMRVVMALQVARNFIGKSG